MRKGPEVEFDEDMEGNFDSMVDWRSKPDVVMEAIDKELAQHGLEIITHETEQDFYAFSIQKIKKVAIKKPVTKKLKVHPLTTQTLKELGTTLKMFGEYTFGDKGPGEVMNVAGLAIMYRALPAAEAAAALLELYQSKEHKGNGNLLAGSIICEMQDWTELFEFPEINEIDW